MSKMLIVTGQIKQLVHNLMKERGPSLTDEDIYEYVNYMIRKERKREITWEQFNEYKQGVEVKVSK